VETGCRGGQGSPRDVAPSGRKEGRKEERKEGRKEGRNSVLGPLHRLNLGSVAAISEIHSASIFTFEVNHRVILISVTQFLTSEGQIPKPQTVVIVQAVTD
jgi:hypothetical protein